MAASRQYSVEHRTKIIETYLRTTSIIATQRQFHRDFPRASVPTRNTILALVQKFRETGSVKNKNKGNSGRRRSARTDDNIETVRRRLEESPRKSTRRLSQETALSRTSVRRILRMDLHLFPYKIQILQAQTAANMVERHNFCLTTSQRIEDNPNFLSLVFFSDEAHFYLSGHVNKQNLRFWAQAQPHEHVNRPLSVEKVTVWCGIGCNGVIGPFFFEENGRTVTVNTDRYIEMLRRKFIPALRTKEGVDMNTVIFQQDGAPPHCSNASLEFLHNHFPNDRLISRRTDNPWPPYSPDLNPCDYFLWGYLKERVYENNPQTREVLKANIRREIRRIPVDMCQRVINNLNVRLATVIQRRGAWIEHILNY